MSDGFDPYYKWLGIPPAEQPPNYYRLLGVAPLESDREVIANAADRQMAHLRTYQAGPHSAESQRLLNEVAAAKVTLLQPAKKTAYDAELQAKLAPPPPEVAAPTPPQAPPIFPPEPWPAHGSHKRDDRPIWKNPAVVSVAAVTLIVVVSLATGLTLALRGRHVAQSTKTTSTNTAVVQPSHADPGNTHPDPAKGTAQSDPTKTGAKPPTAVTNPDPDKPPSTVATVGADPAKPPAHIIGVRPGENPPPGNNAAPPGNNNAAAMPAPAGIGAEPAQMPEVDLLRIVNGNNALAQGGKWEVLSSPLRIKVAAEQQALMALPMPMPPAYELVANVERVAGSDAFQLVLPVANGAATLWLDGQGGTMSWIEGYEGKFGPSKGKQHRGQALRMGQPTTLVCKVRPTKITVSVRNGNWLDVSGDMSRMEPNTAMQIGAHGWLIVGARESTFEIHELKVRLLPPEPGPTTVVKTTTPPPIVPIVPETPPEPVKHKPIPEAAVLDEARKALKEQIADDLAAATDGTRKGNVARTLIDRAAIEPNPAKEYVLLEQAVELGRASGELNLALSAIDTWEDAFAIDRREAEKLAVAEVFHAPRSNSEKLELIKSTLERVQQETARERYGLATDLQEGTLAALKSLRDPALLKEVRARGSDLAAATKQWQAAQEAREKLKTAPDDPEANQIVGMYLASVRSDWTEALPHLQKATSAELRSAADLEQKGSSSAENQLAIAEAWWSASERLPTSAKRAVLEHAGGWYLRAMPQLTGAASVRAKSRLSKIEDIRRATGGTNSKRHPLDAVAFGGHWYKLVEERANWTDAQKACQQQGGYLVCIEAPAENAFVASLITSPTPRPVLTGGMWGAGNPNPQWVNGRPMVYTNLRIKTPPRDDRVIVLFNLSPSRLDWSLYPLAFSGTAYVCEWDK